jgi:threonine dehydratase
VGKTTWPIIRDHVEKIFTVEDRDVERAMSIIYKIFDMIVEPSGAISLAAVLSDEFRKLENIDSIGIILCGGNVDEEKLPFELH